ncbi:hypothetical protein PoB_000323200 [Plakobranchus ocellatus]|uniref:Uncharacterized protein n=1 Tax=Plakobranchus ocellatus TaxID=259542 RepID=A0AAV3Y1X1_9GAST|nr:hypothetical protein PoB_000323200 [Plakobranchus ocellatus]
MKDKHVEIPDSPFHGPPWCYSSVFTLSAHNLISLKSSMPRQKHAPPAALVVLLEPFACEETLSILLAISPFLSFHSNSKLSLADFSCPN